MQEGAVPKSADIVVAIKVEGRLACLNVKLIPSFKACSLCNVLVDACSYPKP